MRLKSTKVNLKMLDHLNEIQLLKKLEDPEQREATIKMVKRKYTEK